ncbi:ankyrin repeat domain-containing protein [Parvularcula flava]|uniref:Ankyrin repeat domain-containing protein n=1 Tax=Aquisalinus luteolus TaxID=1566827 RepID=A0A8J3A975_9PROT|nr:hypothetical protein [Aquisalinus luteolus]NHK29388.1 ankyrin repeat domain-containing protein [Aquisalinus luteolus]GGI00924.1 hypothetical protein GCM10011355_30350 [Aquisalinus luteolus]
MVKINVHTDKGDKIQPPDLFQAARNNDIKELAAAIQDGQSLNDIEDVKSGLTPMHIACIHRSDTFLKAAVQYEFDPWIRDCNLRLAIDHARAQGLRDIQKALFEKMYPPSWDSDPVVRIDR